jgi:RND family efflux transporter MFP subunit
VPVYFWVGLGVLVTAGAVWFIWPAGKSSRAKAGAQAPTQVVRVETVRPTREDLQRVSESSPAEVMAYEQTDIYAKVSGYVEKLYVDRGDVVHPPAPGDKDIPTMVKEKKLLAQLWVPEMLTEREQKQALLDQAGKAYDVAKAQVATAAAYIREVDAGVDRAVANRKRWDSEYKRVKNSKVLDEQQINETWFQFQSALAAEKEAKAKVESAKATLKENEAKRDKALAEIKTARANLDYVDTMLKYAQVVAPYKGVITKLHLHTGAFLSPTKSSAQPIFTITRTDKLRIIVDIPEKDAGYLNLDKDRPNNLVRIKFDALPDLPAKDKPYVWPITRFAPVLGAGKKVRAEIETDNPGGRLFPGMYGHATVILENRPEVLTLPSASLGTNDNGYFVYRVVGGKAQKQAVHIGLNNGTQVEIIDGLSENDQIVLKGKDSLRDGQPVKASMTQAGVSK